MSITTRNGDHGETRILFGRAVAKNHPRVEAYGSVDELTAHLGVARATLGAEHPLATQIRWVQERLQRLCAELATDNQDHERLATSGISLLSPQDVSALDTMAADWEARLPRIRHFLIPGDSVGSAHLHVARSVCRRAERRVWELGPAGHTVRDVSPRFLNRLSDYLWLAARAVDEPLEEPSADASAPQ